MWAMRVAAGAAAYTEDFSDAERFRRDCVSAAGMKVFPRLGEDAGDAGRRRGQTNSCGYFRKKPALVPSM